MGCKSPFTPTQHNTIRASHLRNTYKCYPNTFIWQETKRPLYLRQPHPDEVTRSAQDPAPYPIETRTKLVHLQPEGIANTGKRTHRVGVCTPPPPLAEQGYQT